MLFAYITTALALFTPAGFAPLTSNHHHRCPRELIKHAAVQPVLLMPRFEIQQVQVFLVLTKVIFFFSPFRVQNILSHWLYTQLIRPENRGQEIISLNDCNPPVVVTVCCLKKVGVCEYSKFQIRIKHFLYSNSVRFDKYIRKFLSVQQRPNGLQER